MVVTRASSNAPITFSGQIAAYGAGVANVEQSRVIEEHQDSSSVSNVPLQFDSGKIEYVQIGDNPARYTNIVNSAR